MSSSPFTLPKTVPFFIRIHMQKWIQTNDVDRVKLETHFASQNGPIRTRNRHINLQFQFIRPVVVDSVWFLKPQRHGLRCPQNVQCSNVKRSEKWLNLWVFSSISSTFTVNRPLTFDFWFCGRPKTEAATFHSERDSLWQLEHTRDWISDAVIAY